MRSTRRQREVPVRPCSRSSNLEMGERGGFTIRTFGHDLELHPKLVSSTIHGVIARLFSCTSSLFATWKFLQEQAQAIATWR